jgi:cytochrome P450
MRETAPVQDWTTDFDVLDQGYVIDPFPIWDDLRERCPVASTDRRRRAWLVTSYEAVNAAAHDTTRFSSLDVGVVDNDMSEEEISGALEYGLPPISADVPLHTWTRRILLPWFSHSRVAEYEPITRALCQRLIKGFIDQGHADAAADYAQQIPVRIIGLTLGVPDELADTFTGWVRDVLEFADDKERVIRGRDGIIGYLLEEAERRRTDPRDDLISELVHGEHDGAPIDPSIALGMCGLVLIAGIDTTWSAIGSSLWHLAQHPDDVARLVAEPALMDTAVEELLRAFAPVTMGRVVTGDTEFNGCPMKAEDKVLLSFPAANRDPAAFDRPDEVILDRAVNRHVAFGAGIHRCAGSNLARMELRVAVEEWIKAIPTFHIAEGAEVTWAGGQVRGPRSLPVRFP